MSRRGSRRIRHVKDVFADAENQVSYEQDLAAKTEPVKTGYTKTNIYRSRSLCGQEVNRPAEFKERSGRQRSSKEYSLRSHDSLIKRSARKAKSAPLSPGNLRSQLINNANAGRDGEEKEVCQFFAALMESLNDHLLTNSSEENGQVFGHTHCDSTAEPDTQIRVDSRMTSSTPETTKLMILNNTSQANLSSGAQSKTPIDNISNYPGNAYDKKKISVLSDNKSNCQSDVYGYKLSRPQSDNATIASSGYHSEGVDLEQDIGHTKGMTVRHCDDIDFDEEECTLMFEEEEEVRVPAESKNTRIYKEYYGEDFSEYLKDDDGDDLSNRTPLQYRRRDHFDDSHPKPDRSMKKPGFKHKIAQVFGTISRATSRNVARKHSSDIHNFSFADSKLGHYKDENRIEDNQSDFGYSSLSRSYNKVISNPSKSEVPSKRALKQRSICRSEPDLFENKDVTNGDVLHQTWKSDSNGKSSDDRNKLSKDKKSGFFWKLKRSHTQSKKQTELSQKNDVKSQTAIIDEDTKL